MSYYIDFGFDNKRAVPFISPALAIDSLGNHQCRIHPFIEEKRRVVFTISTITLSFFAISHVAGVNSPLAIIATLGFATPLTIIAGCVALGVLGYKLDQILTNKALAEVAIQEFIDKSNPSHEAFEWLLEHIDSVKLLLQNIEFNKDILSKKDSKGEDLLLKAGWGFGDLKIFTMLCENSSEIHRANTFINLKCKGGFQACKSLNYMVDAKQISAAMFTDEMKFSLQTKPLEPLEGSMKWTEEHLNWIQKLAGVGFNIDAGKKTKTIRYEISAAVYTVALNIAANRQGAYLPPHHHNVGFIISERNICAAMRFLQKSSNLEASRALEGYYWNEKMLEVITPCLDANPTALSQAFFDDNVKIGRLLWDKTDSDETRKYCFIGNFGKKINSKFVDSLLEDGEITANMFTEVEQNHIFKQRCFFPDDKDDKAFEFLHKFVDFGFDIRAKNPDGKSFREVLSDQIASCIISNEKEAMRLTKGLEVVDKILEKQNIATGIVLKQGQKSGEDSNLSMFPDDIVNCFVDMMVATH